MINWTSTRNIDYINIESIGSIHVHLNTLFFVSFNHKLTFTVIKKNKYDINYRFRYKQG